MSSLPLNNDGTTQTQDQSSSAFDSGSSDHEYFAASVEEINVGRDSVTSLTAEPPHVFDIVWNMDLNTALDEAGIKVPYQLDVNEQEHKAGVVDDANFMYELATDNSGPIEIECLKTTDSTNTILEYTFGDDIRSGIGSTEEIAMAELAKQLMVVNNSAVLLAIDKSQDVGSTMSAVMVASISSGIANSFSDGSQDGAIIAFENALKPANGSYEWYSADTNNSRSVTVQVKSGLAQLFDRKPELNNLLGSAASASTFLDSALIAAKMQNSSDDFYLKLFSQAQLKEVLEAVADKGSRVSDDQYDNRKYAFQPGDSITAVVKVKDSDANGTNSDRWLITLQQTQTAPTEVDEEDTAATQPAAPAAVTAYVPTPSTSVGVPNELTITFDDSVSINRMDGGKVNIYQRINGFTSSIIIDASDTTQLTLGTTNNTVKITPTTPMLNNSWNYILIDNTVIEDTSGNPFTSLVSDHTVWNFNIGTPIMSPSLEPVVGVTDIAMGFSPVITFQENIELVNGKNVEIRIHSDDTVVFAETISGSQLTVGVVDGNSMQINPPNDLPGGVKYYVYIEPGTIKNLSGHPFNDAFGNNWYFTTAAGQSAAEQAAAEQAAEQAAAEQAAIEQAAAEQAAIDAVNAAALVAANTTIKGVIDLHNQAYAMYSNSDVVTPTTLIIAATKNMVTQANTGTGLISDPNGVVVYQYIANSWQIRQIFEVVNQSLRSLRSMTEGGSGDFMWGGVEYSYDPKYNYNGVEVISAGAVLSNLVLKYSRF